MPRFFALLVRRRGDRRAAVRGVAVSRAAAGFSGEGVQLSRRCPRAVFRQSATAASAIVECTRPIVAEPAAQLPDQNPYASASASQSPEAPRADTDPGRCSRSSRRCRLAADRDQLDHLCLAALFARPRLDSADLSGCRHGLSLSADASAAAEPGRSRAPQWLSACGGCGCRCSSEGLATQVVET